MYTTYAGTVAVAANSKYHRLAGPVCLPLSCLYTCVCRPVYVKPGNEVGLPPSEIDQRLKIKLETKPLLLYWPSHPIYLTAISIMNIAAPSTWPAL